ncbi:MULTISPECIES: hypothetical protein [Bradyrhizobium]|uniref:GIY-YIG nuclease family protein n=2 Tax=Bradyrhizobium ottawaense TaxID=931866 RepID=A0ABV4FR15_9BRAD|nr:MULTISPECIES: hypothetical protein [Bradyrhizobium]WLB45996.1 hypothetical protein QIH93_36915 [Bradyrhizobium ottawaense]GMO15861.1 hypothetical protein BwSH14_05570 [Bradyrhizobium ottawaense]GMO19080.1 hypothetical protein BwSF21_11860 [Bradyrhizobium ottawaense]GMO44842.1 hypothetical protein BwSF12_49710 [Bradyrhizobium ottawaense]GMO70272.1 hypothetical protein BwSG20_34260 [Bradyrhizobium ottawaense]
MSEPSAATTTIVHRPFGGMAGYRILSDRASRAVVHAFCLTDLAAVSSSGLLAGGCAYLLIGAGMAYVGESGKPMRRLAEHAADPTKAFAQDAFVISGCDGAAFDKSLSLDFQWRLTRELVDLGSVAVVKGANPVRPDLPLADRSTHDRIYTDALRLLHDAGCTIFAPANRSRDVAGSSIPTATDTASAGGADAEDSGPMAIGVSAAAADGESFELTYCNVWARAYRSGGRFVVAAGSDIRTATNDSVDTVTRKRRSELFRAGVLTEIAGVSDRRRLMVAVAFPTESIAAKVVCGAHSTPPWTSLPPRAVVLTV